MKQGNQFFLEFQIEDNIGSLIDITNVLKVQFVIGDLIKTYDGISDEVLWDNENKIFKVWLTEDETFNFDKQTKMDARILFKGDNDYKAIGGTYIESKYWYDSLKKEILDDGEESTPTSTDDIKKYISDEVISEKVELSDGEISTIDLKDIFISIPSLHISGAGNTASNLFNGYTKLKKIGKITNDTLNNVSIMFNNCISLQEVDLSEFDTSKVTNMSGMFLNNKSLSKLDLSNFDTSKVTDMSSMFYDCKSLTNLNISSFDFASVSNYDDMFGKYYSETSDYRIPANCYILVKNASAKKWVTDNFDWLTNVHYVGE